MLESAKNLTAKLGTLVLAVAALLTITGCQTPPQFNNAADMGSPPAVAANAESIVLREGDSLKVSFPGAPNLTTTTPISRDGTITLQLVGPVKAAGKTLAQLKEDLLKLYATQIESKEISVELLSADFPIFVSGAVLRPGKVMSNHPMSVLEAIMECGGPDYTKANLKSVRVLRQEGTHLKTYDLNLKDQLGGKDAEQFYLKPGDIIYVKEKFTWF